MAERKNKPWVIFDLDGTLCDTRHRQHIIDQRYDKGRHDWLGYSMACADDGLIEPVAALAKILHRTHLVMLLTGRNVQAVDLTIEWLNDHDVSWDDLAMRGESDFRHNDVFKKAKVQQLQRLRRFDLAVEDNPNVVPVFAELGIPTLLVQPPDGHQREWPVAEKP